MGQETAYASEGLQKHGALVEGAEMLPRGHPANAGEEERKKRLQQRHPQRETVFAMAGLMMHGAIGELA